MPGSDVQPISTPSLTRLFRRLRSRRHRTRSRSPPPTLNNTLPINEWQTESLYAEWALELLRLQQSFEDMQLQEAPVASSHKFSCAICMEEQLVDNAVELDCSHRICRDCVRGHICSKIEEHRFPVLCPVCMAEQDDPPGVISGRLIRLIGVDERRYATWEEMELSQYSVLLHCRRCRRSVLVDKEEHQESQVLVCPLPNCTHRWCKACQQSIIFGRPHTCDGTSEMDRLMKQKGWKYCPNCKTPFQRNGGCRHMTCISPGCNTHFCYGCGGCIIRSALRTEIEGAVTAHYSGTCRMFG